MSTAQFYTTDKAATIKKVQKKQYDISYDMLNDRQGTFSLIGQDFYMDDEHCANEAIIRIAGYDLTTTYVNSVTLKFLSQSFLLVTNTNNQKKNQFYAHVFFFNNDEYGAIEYPQTMDPNIDELTYATPSFGVFSFIGGDDGPTSGILTNYSPNDPVFSCTFDSIPNAEYSSSAIINLEVILIRRGDLIWK